jgi:hypothetical protein
MYTAEQLKAIYQALRGAQGIGVVADIVSMNRVEFKEQFYPTLETKVNPDAYQQAVVYLKQHKVLQDAQLLTELLND